MTKERPLGVPEAVFIYPLNNPFFIPSQRRYFLLADINSDAERKQEKSFSENGAAEIGDMRGDGETSDRVCHRCG